MLTAGFAVVEPGLCGVSFALGVGVVLDVVVKGDPEAAPEKAGGGAPGTPGIDGYGDCEFAIAPVLVPSKNS